MTRNVTRFLAASLLSLVPSIALAGSVEYGFPDYLSTRGEYVSLNEEAFEVPVRKGPAVQSIGPAAEDFLVLNQTGVNTSLGLQIVTGTFVGVYNPYPIPTGNYGGFQISAPAPTPPPATVVQQYYWTVNPSNPAGSKTCVWRVEVTDVGGTCSAQVFSGTYGGASCTFDAVNSFIDPTTCYARIITGIQ